MPIKPLRPVTLSLGGVSKVSANFNGTVDIMKYFLVLGKESIRMLL